ncbi:Znf414 [Columba livia]|nr:Znf414 [Columba livia]
MKTEKDEAVPTFSLGGKYSGEGAGKHYQCSSYGCKLAFPSMQELMDHLKVHYRPTQSLEGKTFQCPTLGCTETFPSMQDLMAHMKVHYKPNRYFKKKPSSPAWTLPPAAPAALPTSLPELPSSLEAMPLVSPAPHSFPLLEPGLFGPSSLTRFSGPPPSSVPGPFLPYVHPSPYGLPQPLAQHRLRPYMPGHGPPVSNAVWKKSQGHSSNSRIVWEHTRGRYTCMQCPYSTASREEMTLHIEDHRKNPPVPPARMDAGMDFGVGITSFHTKLPPDMENSLYSQL